MVLRTIISAYEVLFMHILSSTFSMLCGKSERLGEPLKQCARNLHHIGLCRRHTRKCDGPKPLAHERQRVSKRGKSFGIPSSLTNGSWLLLKQLMSKDRHQRKESEQGRRGAQDSQV